MPYVLIPNRHTGHRANEYGRPACGARPRESVIVDELPPNRVPCHLCDPDEATPVVEVKDRHANKRHQGARPRRSRSRTHAR